jgi:hypothetical protein
MLHSLLLVAIVDIDLNDRVLNRLTKKFYCGAI